MRLEEIDPEHLMKIAESKYSALMVNALTNVAKAIKSDRAACNAKDDLAKALRDLLDSILEERPASHEGIEANNLWADRRAAACNHAAFILTKAGV